MGFPVTSKIFNPIRASTTALGLSNKQVRQIVSYIDRSPTFTKRIREFEEIGGQIRYSDSDTNYFWVTDRTVYISPANYQNSLPGSDDADVDGLGEVLAHEMSHFVTYYKEQLNPNALSSCDEAAAAGVSDEARAYAQEYLVQSEINSTPGPKVDWMKEGQLEAIEEQVATLPAGCSSEVIHNAATKGLLEWAANYTGPIESAGGYFEFYRNDWLKLANQPVQEIAPHSVRIAYDDAGNIKEIEYRSAGTMLATNLSRDPDTGTFA
jgi:hypothetical protein